MKTPLRYQMTEYDCGPTTMMNAISCLFDREDIPPEIARNIMLYCLDCYGEGGEFRVLPFRRDGETAAGAETPEGAGMPC